MKTIYVKDLQRGQVFESETFAVFEKNKAEDKNGKMYYNILIGDKTGKVAGKIWNDAITSVDTKALKEGNVMSFSGKVDEYRGNLQIVVMSARQVDETSLEEFVESSMFDPDDMYTELLDVIGNIEDKEISKVILSVLEDEDIKANVKYWPAAKIIHHDFRAGLLQHILEMLTVSEGLERFYPDLNFDVLKAGIILHDIGKIFEMDGKNISIPYTRVGQLHGHIYMGARLFEKHADKTKLNKNTRDHILHLILSHHGKLEYGSPIQPATAEAHMLYNIDNVSAKARTADAAIKQMGSDEEFSKRNFFLDNVKLWKVPTDSDDSDQMSLV